MSKHANLKGNPNPIDSEVFIPEAVRRASAAADALQRSSTGTPEPTTPAGTDDETIKIVTPPTPTPPPHVATHVGNEPIEEVVAELTNQPPATVIADADADDPNKSWEHRYKSMRGQFMRSTAEINRLKHSNGELADRVHSLEQLIETMDTPRPAAPTTVAELPKMKDLVTPEEREAFGDEMLDVMGRRALEGVRPLIEGLQAQIADLVARQNTTTVAVHRTEREKMYDLLNDKFPNWAAVNKSQEFIQWLALPNVYSGVTRMKELQAAFENNQASRVLAFFTGFASEQAVVEPETLTTPSAEPLQAPARPAKVKLEDLAAPGRARATGAQAPDDEKPIITTGQIAEFYANVRKGGVYSPEEKEQYEQLIFSAQREGRVR